MEQPERVSSPSEWYVLASRGAVARVRPGMPIGETSAGELSFRRECARLQLDIADDGSLHVTALGCYELESDADGRGRRKRVAPRRRAEIRLPNNLLLVDTNFLDPSHARAYVSISSVSPAVGPEKARPAAAGDYPNLKPAASAAPRPPRRSPPHPAEQQADAVQASDPGPGAGDPDERPQSPAGEQAHWHDPGAQATAHSMDPGWAGSMQPESGGRPPIPRTIKAALGGVAGIVLALLFSSPGNDDPGSPSSGADGIAATPTVPDAVTDGPGPGPATTGDSRPSVRPSDPPVRLSSRNAQQPGVAGEPRDAAELSSLPQAVPEARQDIAPVVLPPMAPRELPVSARNETAREDSPPAPADDAAAPPPADPAFVADLEQTAASLQALATQTRIRRDLLAADLALSSGRLVEPAESSALTLYTSVLAEDPGSQAADQGLQAVRQALVNRALAQLAGGALTEARQTLEDATAAGADARLVADLRKEIDYQQQIGADRD